jgi:ferrous iron transport protein B
VVDGVRQIDFAQSLGVLTTGLYVSLGAVMPYVIAFYAVLGVLEDVGYLPRLAVLLDGVMHRLGLHGYAVIPVILGFGCNVPGILATRVLDTPRERFIAATLISVGVPCAALQAMIMALLAPFGIKYVALVYGALAVVWFVLGTILRLTTKDFLPEMLLEIPPYRLPSWSTLAKKLWMRLKGYLLDATPVVLIGVAVIGVVSHTGVFERIAAAIAPAMRTLFGLPPETALAIVLGFFRKDLAVGMLAPLSLSPLALVKASVMLAVTFPCVASYTVLLREFGAKKTALATGIMVATSLTTGVVMNLVF